MRLLRVELRRLGLRRLVRYTALLGLLGAAFIVMVAALDAKPPSATDLAWAQEAYEEAVTDWAENGEEQVAQCREAEASESELTGEPLDFGCDDLEPRLDWFLPFEPAFEEYATGIVLPFATVLLLLVGALIGATAVAAEFGSGAMSTLLTFEPRRLRVHAAKLGAAALGTIPLGVVMVAIIGGGTWAFFATRGMDSGVSGELLGSGLRAMALVPIAAVGGAVLAFLLRSTAAVLGALLAYAIAIEAILRMSLPRVSPWIPGVNLSGWVTGGTTYGVSECTRSPEGLMCDYVEHQISFAWSTGYLAILGTLLIVLTAWSFNRRDLG